MAKRSKLKPALIIGGIAGGVITAVRKRASSDQLQKAANHAADKASDIAERARAAAPEPLKQAVDKVTGGDSPAAEEETRRYAAPAEAGSQPPADSGGTPADDPHATVARSVVAEDLHTKAHDLPDDVVMPDTSNTDPAVQDAEAAAAADAGAIGGDVDGTGEPGGIQP